MAIATTASEVAEKLKRVADRMAKVGWAGDEIAMAFMLVAAMAAKRTGYNIDKFARMARDIYNYAEK